MIARFLYRLVSLFFFLAAIVCWLMGAGGFALQLLKLEFHLSLFVLSTWAFVLSFLVMQASGEAWRAARYHHLHY